MADFETHAGTSGNATSLTSANASPSPSGNDRYMLAIACGFVSDATAVKYNGSSGTDLQQVGADQTLAGVFTANLWEVVPGPTGSANVHGTFSGSSSNAISALFCEDTDQDTPAEAVQTATGDNGGFSATVVASITITGVEAGQKVPVGLAFGVQGGPTIVSVVAGTDTEVERSDFTAPSGENQAGTAWLTGTAAGTTLTLSATITVSGTFSTTTWRLFARPLIDAAGGGGVPIGVLVANSNQLLGAENAT